MARKFTEFLNECNNGAFAMDAEKMMTGLLQAVQQIGKPGELTIKLKIQPNGDGTASVFPSVSEKRPVKARNPSEFFIHDGSLHKDNPAQGELFEKGKIKSIKPESQGAA